MRSSKFSSGKYAWGLCDTCGFRYKLLDLKWQFIRGQRTGVLSCPTCDDPDHPQNFLDKAVTADPQALRDARPQIDLWPSRRMFPPNIWLGKWAERPDLPIQEKLIADQAIKASNQVIQSDWEQRRFRWTNERNQKR